MSVIRKLEIFLIWIITVSYQQQSVVASDKKVLKNLFFKKLKVNIYCHALI
jgi:hypothetical protein